MKKLISILLLTAMVLTLNTVTAFAAESGSGDTDTIQTDTGTTPRIIFSYEKEVRKRYAHFDDIPEHISYSEYSEEWHGYFSGTLWLDHYIETADHFWFAWFYGTLTGTI
ncbi:MAG: hypothetical protein MR487_11470 [Lachnospiraceae bacterium]|nr:hypothetical protein [Lachnospiraceae bacterium]